MTWELFIAVLVMIFLALEVTRALQLRCPGCGAWFALDPTGKPWQDVKSGLFRRARASTLYLWQCRHCATEKWLGIEENHSLLARFLG